MRRALAIIFAVIFMNGCGSDSDTSRNSITDPGPLPIEDGVFVSVMGRPVVNYYPRDANILISIRTKKIFGCINYYIENTFEQDANDLTMDLLDIGIDGVCFTALGPATASKYLQLDSRKYNFHLFNGSEEDVYRLLIEDDRIDIVPVLTSFSDPAYTTFWLSPENSFALYCYVLNNAGYTCDDFKTYMNTRMKIKKFAFPEEGEKPYPPWGEYYKYCFAEWDDVEAAFIEYCGSVLPPYNGDVTIMMISWEGKYLRSENYD